MEPDASSSRRSVTEEARERDSHGAEAAAAEAREEEEEQLLLALARAGLKHTGHRTAQYLDSWRTVGGWAAGQGWEDSAAQTGSKRQKQRRSGSGRP